MELDSLLCTYYFYLLERCAFRARYLVFNFYFLIYLLETKYALIGHEVNVARESISEKKSTINFKNFDTFKYRFKMLFWKQKSKAKKNNYKILKKNFLTKIFYEGCHFVKFEYFYL